MNPRKTIGSQLALFDLDRVLVESRNVSFHLMDALAKDLGYPSITRLSFDKSWGQTRESFYPDHSPSEIGRLCGEYFHQFTHHLEINPGANGIFTKLRQFKIRIAVVTSTPRKIAEQMLVTAALEPDLLASAQAVARGNPGQRF